MTNDLPEKNVGNYIPVYLGWSFLCKNALLCWNLNLTFEQNKIPNPLTDKLEKMTKHTTLYGMDFAAKIVNPKVVHVKILAEVVYGLSSRDCKGMGICKINPVNDPDYQASKSPCGTSLAYIQVLNSSTIRFEFLKDSITPEQYALRFASGYFWSEEDFCFSDDLLAALETTCITIPKGTYPTQDGPKFITVDFLQV